MVLNQKLYILLTGSKSDMVNPNSRTMLPGVTAEPCMAICYTHRDGSEHISILHHDPEANINQLLKWSTEYSRITFEPMELVTFNIESNYYGAAINCFFTGISNGKAIKMIGANWTANTSNRQGINQFYFRDDELKGIEFYLLSGAYGRGHNDGKDPGLLPTHPPLIDRWHEMHLLELKTSMPGAAKSLERVMQQLKVPGPEYTGDHYLPFGIAP
jgi:hypothetical protein